MLVACSDDLSENNGTKILMQFVPYGRTYVESDVLTRGIIEDDYQSFTTMYPKSSDAIAVYLSDGTNCEHAGDFTPSAGGTWTSTVNANIDTQYYVYGFYPADCCTSENPVASTDWPKGATITLPGLSTFSTDDVCVISGVKEFGKYGFMVSEDGNSNVSKLFLDHIYSGIRLEFNIDEDYAEIRTIKLKEVKLETTESVDDKKTATITVSDNSPAIEWSAYSGATSGKQETDNLVIFPKDDDGNELKPVDESGNELKPVEEKGLVLTKGKDFQLLTDVFVPAASSTLALKIVSTYDVYDKEGTRIRNCTATNTIILGKDPFDNFSAGTRNIIKLTVKPTYLYKLSQPDTDYPTIVIE